MKCRPLFPPLFRKNASSPFEFARSDPRIPAESHEIFENILLYDDRRVQMSLETSRRADDEIEVAEVSYPTSEANCAS